MSLNRVERLAQRLRKLAACAGADSGGRVSAALEAVAVGQKDCLSTGDIMALVHDGDDFTKAQWDHVELCGHCRAHVHGALGLLIAVCLFATLTS